MISTERFLAILEEKDLLPSSTLEVLRKQIARKKKPVSAEAVARKLIEEGYLTPVLAKRLLASGGEEEASPAKPSAKPQREAKDSNLGLAPLDDEPAQPDARSRAKAVAAKEAATAKKVAKSTPRTPAEPAKPRAGGSLLDEELPSLAGGAEASMGPLDGLLSGAALDAAAGGSPLAPVAAKKSLWRKLFPKQKAGKQKEDWGSSLMLIGGGGLLLLVILVVALLWWLSRGSGDQMFQVATDAYRAGAYAQAIKDYTLYLEKNPHHSGASVARVRVGLSKLRQVTQERANWSEALQTANEVLSGTSGEPPVAGISTEPDFKEAYGDLASMLPTIAEGLAADARKKTDAKLVEQARATLALTDKFVPKSLRPTTKLADIEASLAVATRDIARATELEKAVAAMQEAVKQSKTPAAYDAYNALLRQYPELASDAKLADAVAAVSLAQQALVKKVQEPKTAETSDRPTAALSAVTLTHRTLKTPVPDAEGLVALAAVDGAVYGLDAASGKTLWRRFVGFDANPQAPSFPPTPLSADPGSDALLVDTAAKELLRVEGATGKLRWRHSVGEPFDAYPVVANDRILVATRSGKLITLDAETGDSAGYLQLPQGLRVAPVVDPRRSMAYQVADHTNIFVLSLADGACRQVVHLGHQLGGVVTAPALVNDSLLVAVNDGARDATLHVLAVQSAATGKEPLLKAVQQIKLKGRVQTPIQVAGRRALVVTDAGTVRVFELTGSDAKTALREVADTILEDAGSLARFALLQDGQFWIADKQLTKYDVQAARGRLVPKFIVDEDSVFLQPPTAFGQSVVTVRRKTGVPGAFVAAIAVQEPDRHWETQVAAPLAGAPIVAAGSDKITVVTAAGSAFRLDGKSGSKVLEDTGVPADASRAGLWLRQNVRLSGGLAALSAGPGTEQIAVLDPAEESPHLRWFKLPDKLACPPVAFAAGLLVPGKSGQVSLLDPSGKSLAEPFQPRLEAGAEVSWQAPASVGEKEVVISDGAAKLYRLGIADEPKPSHLAVLAEAAIADSVVAPLAAVGDVVYAVNGSDTLVAFELPKLGRGREVTLSGHCAFGPVRVGERVLLATDDDQLLCMGSKGDLLWKTAMAYGPLAGAPLAVGDHLLLASRSGVVWRIDAANGKELGKVEVGSPLGAGPTALGDQLLLGGHDGTLYEVRQP